MTNAKTKDIQKSYIQQVMHEKTCVVEGNLKYIEDNNKKIRKGELSETLAARTLISNFFPSASMAISNLFDNAAPAARPTLIWGETLGANVCAMLALSSLFNNVGKTFSDAIRALSKLIEAELKQKALQEKHPGLAHYLADVLKQKHSHKQKRGTLNKAVSSTETPSLPELGFTAEKLTNLSIKLLDATISSTRAFAITESNQRGMYGIERSMFITLQPAVLEAMRYIDDKASWMNPVRPVMLVKPNKWDSSLSGGYLTEDLRTTLIKTKEQDYIMDAIESQNMSKCFNSLNVLQETSYSINAKVLAVALECVKANMAVGCMISQEELAKPENPADLIGMDRDAYKELYPEEFKKWRTATAKVHSYNNSRVRQSNILLMNNCLREAEEVLGKVFYLPVQLDTRGRVYYLPSNLNPQTHDLAKALLQFGEGEKMTPAGRRALAIAGATTWCNGGLDKTTMDAREEWVYANQDKIIACAKDPMSNLWWTEADYGVDKKVGATSWSFLRFCIEWAAMCEAEAAGVDFYTTYINYLDGKCNGSQHHSAMVRDAITAEYVCMTPQVLPNDFYTRVLEAANEQIAYDIQIGTEPMQVRAKKAPKSRKATLSELDALAKTGTKGLKVKVTSLDSDAEDEEPEDVVINSYTIAQLAGLLQGKLTRGIVKRGAMTYGYGVTRSGVRNQLVEKFMDFFNQFDKQYRNSLIKYLGNVIYDAVERTASSSATVKNFLHEIGTVMSSHSLPVSWITADGFPARQCYYESNVTTVKTEVSGVFKASVDTTQAIRNKFGTELEAYIKNVVGGSSKEEKAKAQKLFEEVMGFMDYISFRGMVSHVKTMVRAEAEASEIEDYLTKTIGDLMPAEFGTLVCGLVKALQTVLLNVKESERNRINISINEFTKDLHRTRNASGLAPNFTHSQDATHCRMTVNACAEFGIKHFAAVHDSFGVHSTHIDKLNEVLRDQFIELYKDHDPLKGLIDVCKQSLPEESRSLLPQLPEYGTFDLEQVRQAAYFFA